MLWLNGHITKYYSTLKKADKGVGVRRKRNLTKIHNDKNTLIIYSPTHATNPCFQPQPLKSEDLANWTMIIQKATKLRPKHKWMKKKSDKNWTTIRLASPLEEENTLAYLHMGLNVLLLIRLLPMSCQYSLQCHHQNDCIKAGRCARYF